MKIVAGAREFSLLETSGLVLGPIQTLFNGYRGSFKKTERLGRAVGLCIIEGRE